MAARDEIPLPPLPGETDNEWEDEEEDDGAPSGAADAFPWSAPSPLADPSRFGGGSAHLASVTKDLPLWDAYERRRGDGRAYALKVQKESLEGHRYDFGQMEPDATVASLVGRQVEFMLASAKPAENAAGKYLVMPVDVETGMPQATQPFPIRIPVEHPIIIQARKQQPAPGEAAGGLPGGVLAFLHQTDQARESARAEAERRVEAYRQEAAKERESLRAQERALNDARVELAARTQSETVTMLEEIYQRAGERDEDFHRRQQEHEDRIRERESRLHERAATEQAAAWARIMEIQAEQNKAEQRRAEEAIEARKQEFKERESQMTSFLTLQLETIRADRERERQVYEAERDRDREMRRAEAERDRVMRLEIAKMQDSMFKMRMEQLQQQNAFGQIEQIQSTLEKFKALGLGGNESRGFMGEIVDLAKTFLQTQAAMAQVHLMDDDEEEEGPSAEAAAILVQGRATSPAQIAQAAAPVAPAGPVNPFEGNDPLKPSPSPYDKKPEAPAASPAEEPAGLVNPADPASALDPQIRKIARRALRKAAEELVGKTEDEAQVIILAVLGSVPEIEPYLRAVGLRRALAEAGVAQEHADTLAVRTAEIRARAKIPE